MAYELTRWLGDYFAFSPIMKDVPNLDTILSAILDYFITAYLGISDPMFVMIIIFGRSSSLDVNSSHTSTYLLMPLVLIPHEESEESWSSAHATSYISLALWAAALSLSLLQANVVSLCSCVDSSARLLVISSIFIWSAICASQGAGCVYLFRCSYSTGGPLMHACTYCDPRALPLGLQQPPGFSSFMCQIVPSCTIRFFLCSSSAKVFLLSGWLHQFPRDITE